jgi:hypothetical protein
LYEYMRARHAAARARMHDAAAKKNKIVRARRARAACAGGQRSYPDIMQVADSYSCNYSCSSTKCTMMRHMMATASAVLQLRTQFLYVLLRPVKTLNKPFESLQSAAEPRQGAFRHSHG